MLTTAAENENHMFVMIHRTNRELKTACSVIFALSHADCPLHTWPEYSGQTRLDWAVVAAVVVAAVVASWVVAVAELAPVLLLAQSQGRRRNLLLAYSKGGQEKSGASASDLGAERIRVAV